MVLLMGDFLSERKHTELSSPAITPPLARGPRGYVADDGAGVAAAEWSVRLFRGLNGYNKRMRPPGE